MCNSLLAENKQDGGSDYKKQNRIAPRPAPSTFSLLKKEAFILRRPTRTMITRRTWQAIRFDDILKRWLGKP
jgi:hypothetical protein